MLWRCWLGGRKGIRPVKNWVVGVWSEVQTCIWSSWCHCHSLSLASVKSRLVLPFWYRLTWVVLRKRAIKRVCACVFFVRLWIVHARFVVRRWYGATTISRGTGKRFGLAATWKLATPTLCEFAATPLARIDLSTPTSTPWRDWNRTWSAAATRHWNSDDRPTTCSTFWWSESTRLRDWTPSADSTPPDSFSSNNFTWVSFCFTGSWDFTGGCAKKIER